MAVKRVGERVDAGGVAREDMHGPLRGDLPYLAKHAVSNVETTQEWRMRGSGNDNG